jgi:TPR repeat protein
VSSWQLSVPDAAALIATQSLAVAGDAHAQAQMGTAYLVGKGLPQDTVEALSWLKMSAAGGSGEGQYLLGKYYVLHGKAEDDFRAAASWLKKSADQGCVQSYAYLGILSLSGKGTTKNAEEGFRLVLKAAEADYALAQVMVGTLLITGEGASKDPKAGFSWVKRAADAGDSVAAILLASLYLEGMGTTKAPEKTRTILEAVYKKGDEQAHTAAYHLGWMYMEGKGVPADNVKAFRWMLIAADARVSDSESRLKTLTDQLPKQKLSTTCSVYMDPHFATSGAKEYLHAAIGEIVAVLSSDKNKAEVFFPDRPLVGFISRQCLSLSLRSLRGPLSLSSTRTF